MRTSNLQQKNTDLRETRGKSRHFPIDERETTTILHQCHQGLGAAPMVQGMAWFLLHRHVVIQRMNLSENDHADSSG